MNYKLTTYLSGILVLFVAALLVVPAIVSASFGEAITMSYLWSMAILLVVGIPLVLFFRPKNTSIKAKGGFVTVALCWIIMSFAGSLPFAISGVIPNFVDALFESVSGFTTTGSTTFSDIEVIPQSLLMWRSLCHWIGGMGVLVFVIALLPKADGKIYQVFKAEVPGPQKGKLVSKLSITARILMLMYCGLTLLLAVLLAFGGLPVYDCFVLAFSAASTGGFSHLNSSIASYGSLYIEIVVTVFMFLSSVNFTLFYFALIGKTRDVLKSEELRWFVTILLAATAAISLSLYFSNVYESFWTCLRYSLFQSTSVMSTTGFVFTDITKWNAFSQAVLLLLMFVGGCAGSTAGGLKVSRIIIMSKSATRLLKSGLNSNQLVNVKLDGKVVEKDVVHNTFRYLMLYIAIVVVSVLLLTIYNPAFGGAELIFNSFDAVVGCINNVGVGMNGLFSGNVHDFTPLSKVVLIVNMLLGRLELLPICLLFAPSAWRR